MAKRSTDEHTSSQPPRLTSKQTSIAQALESGSPYDKSSRRYCEIRDTISYLAKDMVPINAVTKDGFKTLILTLDKRYRIPSHTLHFPTDHAGENIVSALKDALAGWGLNEEGQVCITTDNAANIIRAVEINGWTSLQCFGHRLHLAIGKCSYII